MPPGAARHTLPDPIPAGRGPGSNPPPAPARRSTVWDAPDDALVAGLGAGDADAAVALVRRFQRRIYGLALTIVGDPVTAEDVAQETFLRAWRHAAAAPTG